MAGLAPPDPNMGHSLEDPGAHELAEHSEDDHFSDASEGNKTSSPKPPSSPIPTTRVERVDDNPSYGEVPGTAPYKLRTQDAVPDEIEVVPEGQRSRSASRLREEDRPLTPGGTPVPKMIVEKVDPDVPSYGDVPGTAAYDMRTADAEPDEVRVAPPETRMKLEGSPTVSNRSRSRSPPNGEHAPGSRPVDEDGTPSAAQHDYDEFNDGEEQPHEQQETDNGMENTDDAFGDDFDDFEEGGAGGEDDDFGDFDDGFQGPEPVVETQPEPIPSAPDPLAGLPDLNFAALHTPEDIFSAIDSHLKLIFPEIDPSVFTSASVERQTPPSTDPILTDRSASLWAQLVAPPPLQPPNWIRSRIRRLFLVSLGVPVDLDEILPASKQKKLVLPSVHLTDSPRSSSQTPRLKNDNEPPSTSLDSSSSGAPGDPSTERAKTGGSVADRPGPPPPPGFDVNAASLLARTTHEKLQGYSDEELRAHVRRLDDLVKRAGEVLEYWLRRKDGAVTEKEAFEGVIENLVAHVRAQGGGRKGRR